MRERIGLWLLLAGTFVLARVAVSLAVSGAPPRSSDFLLHAALVPAAQAALLAARRRKDPRCASS